MSESSVVLVGATATGVLGEYSHSFTLGERDDFVIVYGPNGVGKTKFLEIIDALSRLQAITLSRLPFETATLEYSDGSQLSVRRSEVDPELNEGQSFPGYSIRFALSRPNSKSIEWNHADDEFAAFLRRQIRYEQVDDEYWMDQSDGELVHIDELRAQKERRIRPRNIRTNSEPEDAREFVDQVPSFLIETQRLRIEQVRSRVGSPLRTNPMREPKRTRSRVTDQAEKIRSLLNDAQTEHSRITQRLDRTFPNRVLRAAANDTSLNSDSIRQRYNLQNDFRSRLGRVASVSLDDELSLPDTSLDDWALTLLNQYLDDADKKLAPFEGLLKKIELLEAVVNGHLLNKSLQVTDGDGLTVQHEQTGANIALDSLSSGEQHEIILMIDLLFNVPAGAVVLIDEPEISLHIAWQLAFIPDVKKIAELAGFRFVVATHSPQIINDEWERAIRLGPDEGSFS